MAHLWQSTKPGEWVAQPLVEGTTHVPGLTFAAASLGWSLFTDSALVFINGHRVLLDIVALRDRDEIRIADDQAFYFSTEVLARIEAYRGSAGACPRCRLPIADRSDAVRCPQCGLWHHESADLPCWTYAPQCAACAQRTALDTGFGWTPAEL